MVKEHPEHLEQAHRCANLLCAVVDRAEKDARGEGMGNLSEGLKRETQADARVFLREIGVRL